MSSLPLPLWPEAERPARKAAAVRRRRAFRSGVARDPAADRNAGPHGRGHRPAAAGRVPVAARPADGGPGGGLPDPGPRGGQVRPLQAALELSRRHYPEQMLAGPPLANPRATREFLRARLRDREYEVFCCLFLDNRHRVIAFDEVFPGHDRRRQRPSPRGRQAGPGAQRGGGHPGAQPSLRRRRAQPGGRADHRPAAGRAGAGGYPGARPHRRRGRSLRIVCRAGLAVGTRG